MDGPANPLRVAAVVPCYRVRAQIAGVLAGVAPFVDTIFVVDDACPEGTGAAVRALGAAKTQVLRHARNAGVGAATVTGYRAALAAGFDVVVKLDGDGQMDPAELPALLRPLLDGAADYATGDRLRSAATIAAMPGARRVGNRLITRLARAMAGAPGLSDPMNGFTAITAGALAALPLDRLERRFFFETDLLVRLAQRGARIVQVPMPARYGAERSNLGIGHILLHFPPKIAAHLLARAWRRSPTRRRRGSGRPVPPRSAPWRRPPP